ncbi:MAG: hypothetical protein EA405_08505 [Rhodospirillales bacterium]|nr:MAG: hypothetical protein EA405_08505 [Rhodospirillales bacterium]
MRLVQAFLVLAAEPGANPGARCRHGLVGMQVDFLVFHDPPPRLDEDVDASRPVPAVESAVAAVHKDRCAVRFEHAGQGQAGEQAALVGVETRGSATSTVAGVWTPMLAGFFEAD